MMPRGERDEMTAPPPPFAAGRDRVSVRESGAEPLFHRRFSATDRDTRETLVALMQVLDRAGIGAEDCGNVELILAEALNNVAEHAYADGAGPVELSVILQQGGLACTISDRGRPMPMGVVPSPGLPAIAPPDDLPEGGFGWHIIRCLATDLSYHRDRTQNHLSLRVPWSGFD